MKSQSSIPSFRKIRKIVSAKVKAVARDKVEEFAIEMREYITDGILLQRFESFIRYPLSASYLQRKERKGLDHRVLIATGHYVNSITVIKHSKINFEVNVPKNAKAWDENKQPTEISLRTIGAIHEFGSVTANLPARSHWRVAYKEAVKRSPAIARKIAREAVKQINADLQKGV